MPRISVRLESEEDLAWLEAHGGTSRAVRNAIEAARHGRPNREQLRLLRQIAEGQAQLLQKLDELLARL